MAFIDQQSHKPSEMSPGLWTAEDLRRGRPVMVWEVEKNFDGFPAKVVRAKLKALVRRCALIGCACGCRGDFKLGEHMRIEAQGEKTVITISSMRSRSR